MSNFRPIDRETGFLLPPSVDEWLPKTHLARFVVEVIDGLDLSAMTKSYRGSGSASYHPAVLLGIVVYGYATGGVFEPQAGTCNLRFGRRALPDGEPASRPRHPCDVSAAISRADRGAVRSGAAGGARDGHAQAGHRGARRHEDPCQCQSAQCPILRACDQDRGAAEG